MAELLKALKKARDDFTKARVDEGDSEQVAESKWKAFVESWFSRNHAPCVIADWHGRSTLHDLVQFFIVCGLVLQNDAEFKSYTTILISLPAGPGIPYDVSAAVGKQHKKFYQRQHKGKQNWQSHWQGALGKFGIFSAPRHCGRCRILLSSLHRLRPMLRLVSRMALLTRGRNRWLRTSMPRQRPPSR